MSFAVWLNKRLLERGPAPDEYNPPGGKNHARRWKQADGSEVAIVAHGDSFDIYLGEHGEKGAIYNLTLDLPTARKLALWLLVWFTWVTWLGLRTRLWDWSLRKIYDERARAQERTKT